MRLMEDFDFRAALTSFLVAAFVGGALAGIEVSSFKDLAFMAVAFYFANKSTLDQSK